MHEQNRYNTSNMRYQTDLQRELNEQAFNYNNYFWIMLIRSLLIV